MKIIRRQFQSNNFGKPQLKFGESVTVQNDVPTLKEILERYQKTGEIIGTSRQSYYDDNQFQDCDVIVPDVEDLNRSHQNLREGERTKSFLSQKSLSEDVQPLKNIQDGTPPEDVSKKTVE